MKPSSAIFLLTYNCNQNCLFCLNTWKGNSTFKKEKELSFEEKKNVLDKLKEFGIKSLIISGGEPLMEQGCTDIIDYAFKKGFNIIIQSNGSFIDKNFLEKVKGKIKGIEISLEGLEEEHNKLTNGNFKRSIEKIKLVKSFNIPVFTNFTITKLNHKSLEDYVKLLENLKVDIANFTRLYLAGEAMNNKDMLLLSKEEYYNFLKQLSEIKSRIKLNVLGPTPLCFLEGINLNNYTFCSAGKSEITIYPNGSVSFCPSWPWSLGNVMNDSLESIWNGFNLKFLRHGLSNDCKSCDKFKHCGGGCILPCNLKNGMDMYTMSC